MADRQRLIARPIVGQSIIRGAPGARSAARGPRPSLFQGMRKET